MWKSLEEIIRTEGAKAGANSVEFSVLSDKKASGVVEVGSRMVSIEVLDNFVYDCLIIEADSEEIVFSKTRALNGVEELRNSIQSDLSLAKAKSK